MGETRKGSNTTKEASHRSKRSCMSIFEHADSIDYFLMALGFLGAVGDGLSIPLSLLINSHAANEIGFNSNSSIFIKNIVHNVHMLLYLALGSSIASFLEGYCWMRTGERQTSRMRKCYLSAVLRQDIESFETKAISLSEVVNSISNDSQVIQDFLSEKVPNLIMNWTMFVAGYLLVFIRLWRLAVVVLPISLLLIVPGLIYSRVLPTLTSKSMIEYNKAALIAEQAISFVRTVYAFRAEKHTTQAFSKSLHSSFRLGLQQGLAKSLALGTTGLNYLIWAFMVWYNGGLIRNHGANGGTTFTSSYCITMGSLALGSSLSNIKYYGEAVSAIKRINEMINQKPLIDSESEEGEELEEVRGKVEFKDVRFSYPMRPNIEVLKGFSLIVPSKKTLALVGESGSGKSTMITLLQRFYDHNGGEILVDGVDIRRFRLKWLRAQMGLVSQEPALFAMSIKENILFGKEDATMEDVMEAAKIANATEFISKLPLGYDTQVGERGVQLSGGQKQRIAIARAIIRSPKILLLDEATSALDSKSEKIVQDSIDAAKAGRTTIIIAHRISTIRNADTIAFMQNGKIVEIGTHEDLTSNINSYYSSLFTLQESQTFSYITEANSNTNFSHFLSPKLELISLQTTSNEDYIQDENLKFSSPSFWSLVKLSAPEWRQGMLGCIGAFLIGAVQPSFGFVVGSVASIYFFKDFDEMKLKLMKYSLLLAAISLFCFLVNIMQHYNLEALGEYLTRRIRERLFSKMLTFEVGWFDRDENSTGSICSRLSKDANIVRSLVGDRMSIIIQTLSGMIIANSLGLLISWRLAVMIIFLQPLDIISFYMRIALLKKSSKKILKGQSESSKLVAEATRNLRTITAFSSQDRILKLFELAVIDLHNDSLHQSWIAGVGIGSSQFISQCIYACVMWYGGLLISNGSITGKDFFQTTLIIMGTSRVIAEAGALTSDLSKGSNTVASIFAILNRYTLIESNNPKDCKVESLKGEIEFLNVDYAYPTRPDVPILKNFSISIKAGISTALVGPSGSGKSTVISLIERFYDPLHGVINIDGKDIKSYNLSSLRQYIAFVGQEPVLFAGTIRDNIAYGMTEKIYDAEIEAAAKASNAYDFICSLPDGFQTSCGDNGLQLSGGQKQRIAIARAILCDPRILLLDEATSALDRKSEIVVQEALEKVMFGRTTLMVAHRLNTVKKCDVIAVLEEGVLVEKGSHSCLMNKGPKGKYYELVSMNHG